MTDAGHRSYFRPDIEGLRAVAIGVVLLFHAGVPGTEGGFIGVDVFFVISGFLITGLLVREWSGSGHIDLFVFYARRFRRLVPAAMLVIVVTTAAAWLVLSELRFPVVAGDAAAAALYVSNIRFATHAIDYLASEVAPSPLLHTWSLGVEEQFYLFWPLIVLMALRLLALRRLWLVVGGVAIGSLALSLVWTDTAAPWAFFSLPTRAWELGVGALIAIGVLRLPSRTPPMVASASVWLGLALIAMAVVAIDSDTPYPGTAATIPVAGAALVIIGGSHASAWPSRLLATRFPRWVGRISYSLYLWHWPILVLVPLALGIDSVAFKAGLIVVATAFAWASTELLETPIRSGRLLPLTPRKSILMAISGSIIVAAGALAVGAISQGPQGAPSDTNLVPASVGLPDPIRSGALPPDLAPPLSGAYSDLPDGYGDGCHLGFAETDAAACTYGPEHARARVLLLGDSHAQQWLPTLQALADERGWRLRAITKSACPMIEATVWNAPLKRGYRECDAWRERALELIEAEEPDLVFVASASMYQLIDEQGARRAASEEELAETLADYLARMTALAPVVVIADTPRIGYDPAECLATSDGVDDCDVDRERMVDAAYARIEEAAAARAGAGLISATEWLCFEDDCPLIRGPLLVFRDHHHLTATFAAQLSERFGAALDAAIADAGRRR